MPVVTSKRAREKYAQAHGSTGAIPQVVKMAFGDAGVNAANEPLTPDVNAVPLTLGHQLLIKDLVSTTYPVSTTVRYTCRLLQSELNGKDISEVALIDSDGDVVALKTFTKKSKDTETELLFEWDEEF